MQSKRKVRNAAIAYWVWCKGTKAEWDITLAELADAAAEYFNDRDINVSVIQGVATTHRSQGKTWMNLMRCATPGETAGYAR